MVSPKSLGITRKAAQQYIDTYFEKYPGVKTYMEEVVREAKDKGYVETLYHRRRYLPDINSRNLICGHSRNVQQSIHRSKAVLQIF